MMPAARHVPRPAAIADARRRRCLAVGALVAAVYLALSVAGNVGARQHQAGGRVVHQGIEVELSLLPADGGEPLHPPRQGDDVVFRFRIADTATGTPLPGANPAAWLGRRVDGEEMTAERCTEKVSTYLGGSIFSSADLDLNAYYVLALNDDATITVVDPLFGFGDTKLLAMIELPGPGEDWVMTADEATLFVSVPSAGSVAVIDTAAWELVDTIEVGGRPGRIGLQPDGRYLWVAGADLGLGDGIVVIDVEARRVERFIDAGAGPYELAFSDDSRFVFVVAAGAGRVSVLDGEELETLVELDDFTRPVSVDFAPMSRMAYVSDAVAGSIAVIDPRRRAVVDRIVAEPGLGQVRFAPERRWGLVVNPAANAVYVIDAVTSRIVQTAFVLEAPDQIAFSDQLAYIRHLGDETVLMIPLVELGRSGEQIGTVDFPGGQTPFGAGAAPSPAAGIVQASGANAVLVANPADRTIYFYMEGMAAPMGNFNNYGRQPRAVLVVDRSLTEARPGVYETVAKLRDAGTYDVAFFLDAPRIVHCFAIEVAPDPSAPAPAAEMPVVVEALQAPRTVGVGAATALRFRLTLPQTSEPVSDATDVQVLTFLAPGTWQQRSWAREVEPGIYETTFTAPRPGIYYVYVGVASLGLGLNNPQYVIIRAVARSGAAGEATEVASDVGEAGPEGRP